MNFDDMFPTATETMLMGDLLQDQANLEHMHAEYGKRIKAMETEIALLRAENATLKVTNERLTRQADVDAASAVGMRVQTKALVAEIDACPAKDSHHPLAAEVDFVNGVTGKPEKGRAGRKIFREAFDEEAKARGIDNPERFRP
jgi:hypothetical protein